MSLNSSMTPLVHDVDPVLYPGSNMDNRAGSVSSGTLRNFVVGERRADLASDYNRYSRALQANTLHYYTVNCDGSTQSGTFTTVNPPLGNNFPEPPPFDATAFGNYAWPTIDWNDLTKTYVDPMTGILLKRATAPGWYGQSATAKTFDYAIDVNHAWTNTSNILSGTSGTLASYSGLGGDPVFVAFDPSQVTGFGGASLGGWQPHTTLDNVMVRIFGKGNATISGCLTDNSGASCTSPPVDFVTLTSGTGNPAGTYPVACGSDAATGCFPNNGFWGGWKFTPTAWQMTGQQGQVNVSGTNVTAAAYMEFNLNWKSGSKVFINGSSCPGGLCTIVSVNSSSSLTIAENAGSLSQAYFKTANSGIMVWVKRGSSSSSAQISLNMDYAYSDQFTMPLNGTTGQCSSNPVQVSYAADGVTPIAPVQGQLCLAAHQSGPQQALYLMIPSTGETRFLAPIYFFNGSDAQADQVCCGRYVLAAGFDATDPNTIYAQVNTSGGTSVFRGVYNQSQFKFKAYGHSLYPSSTIGYAPGEDTTQYWWQGPAWSDTGITWTNITKASLGEDLGAQIAAKDPNYDPSLFYGPAVTGVSNGKAFTSSGPVGYGETINLIHSFDLNTGKLVQSADTWSKFPARWCSMHTNEAQQGWYGLVCNVLGGAYTFGGNSAVVAAGPFQMTPTALFKNGAFSSNTSMTVNSPLDTCPVIPAFLASLVPANPACVTFQSQMACSHTPAHGENTKWPCEYNSNWSELQPMAPGDGLLVPNGTGNSETLLILSIQSLGNANYQFTAVRGSTYKGYQPAPNGWAGFAVPPTTACDPTIPCTPGIGLWFGASASTVSWLLDPGAFAGHSDLGNAPTPGANSFCQSGYCRFNVPMAQQIGTYNGAVSFNYGTWNGSVGAIALQGYPSLHQLTAPPTEQVWQANFAHINPSYGAGAEAAADVGQVSYSQVSGTKSVFRFTSVNGGLNYKSVPVIAYAGYHLLQDVSSPTKANTITDQTPWQFCVVYTAGECQNGSATGEVYLSAPQGIVRGSQNCVSNWYDDNYPCVFTPPVLAASTYQQGIAVNDPQGIYQRKITMAFSGPGRQFEFGTFIPDPTGAWGFVQGFWLDGVRNDILMAKLPPWPGPAATPHTGFATQTIPVPANSSQPSVRVRFGYAEDGPAASLFCTPRQESCVAGGSPYSFASENPAWQSCSGGCNISVPAIAGRVLYYAIDRKDASGNITAGSLQLQVVAY